MRVLFYNHTGRISGAERVLLMALKHVDQNVIEPLVVCPDGPLVQEVEKLGVARSSVQEIKARFTRRPDKLAIYAFRILGTVLELRKTIEEARCDVIHANSIRAGIAALLASIGSRKTVFWHVHDELKPHAISTAIRLLVRAFRRCRIIAVSNATADSFRGDGFIRVPVSHPITVIHNAADLSAVDQADVADLSKEFGSETSNLIFGIVGQITPRKGQLELVEAFAKASKNLPDARLVIVGAPIFNDDETYFHEVKRSVVRCGISEKVHFLGHRSDALSVIKALDTLIINSRSEAFVMVGLEAMACATPVIATNVGGTREMIEDGANGLLITSGDEDELKTAIERMYLDKDLRKRCATLSRERVERFFDAPRFAREFEMTLTDTSPLTAAASQATIGAPACENR